MLIPMGFGEREKMARSIRWPLDLVKRIAKVSEETHHEFSTTVFHLVTWALDEYDRQRAAEKKGRAV